MKATERHELKKSELVKIMEKAQAFFQTHGTKVLGVIVAAIVIAAAIWYINNTARIARQQAMEQVLAIQSGRSVDAKPEDLRAIAQETSDEKISALAWKLYGDALYNQTLTDKDAKVKELQMQAEEAYNTVDQAVPPTKAVMPSPAPNWGRGAIYEDQANWNQAAQVYQQVADNSKLDNTGLREMARTKLAALDSIKKAAQNPMPTSQPATTQTKPSTSPATTLEK